MTQNTIAQVNNGVSTSATLTTPLWLLAEVTYRCPLHCAFCYNPTDYDKHTQNELTTEQWIQTLRDARKLGAIDVYKRQVQCQKVQSQKFVRLKAY